MATPASVLLQRLLARARLRQLQVLVQLGELGSVRRTADAVGLTQPAVTQILGDLEAMLEVRLFERHARGVSPTAAGADLLPAAKQVMASMAAGADALAARQDQGAGVVRLLASTAAVNGLLVRALPVFNQRHPSVQVQLKEGDMDGDLLLAIARGDADMIGCRRPSVVPQGWSFHSLLQDEFVVACAAGHPLARRRRLEWPALENQVWLPAPAGSAARAYLDLQSVRCAGGLQLCQVITRVPAATWWLLRESKILTLVPLSVVRHLVEAGELAVLDMAQPMPFEPLGMLLPAAEARPAAQQLAGFLAQFVSGADAAPPRRKIRSHAT